MTTEKNQPVLPLDNKETAPTTQITKPANKQLAPWKDALLKAEGRFLAITDPKTTKSEMGFAAMLIGKSPELQKCSAESIINAVINVARTGITLNPVLKLAHLVPRNGECILDYDYKGLVKVLKDYKCLKDIQAIIVYEDEEFEESVSSIEAHKHKITHSKTEEEHKKRGYKGVYCRVVQMDNTMMYTPLMPYWEVLKAEKTSKSANSAYSPWKNWRESMIKKTKIKSDFKLLISGAPPEAVKAILEIEEENNGLQDKYKSNNKGGGLSALFDAEAEEANIVS